MAGSRTLFVNPLLPTKSKNDEDGVAAAEDAAEADGAAASNAASSPEAEGAAASNAAFSPEFDKMPFAGSGTPKAPSRLPAIICWPKVKFLY